MKFAAELRGDLVVGRVTEDEGVYALFHLRHEMFHPFTPELAEALQLIRDGVLSRGDRDVFRPLLDDLMARDDYLLFADFADYMQCQESVSNAWRDAENWTRMSILNTARMGRFSSDRAIHEYCKEIWGVRPVRVHLDD